MQNLGRLPWQGVKQFNEALDALPHGPDWLRQTITITGDRGQEIVDFWYRSGLDVVQHLISNRRFQHNMRYGPEKHWTSEERLSRVFSEMWTAGWWWRIQV